MVKSAIQIFCRIKPSKGNIILYDVDDDDSQDKSKLELIVPREISDGYVNNKKENHIFGFNQIFDQRTTQDVIFNQVAKGVVDNVLSGYNGTIFAYGQTGSGKTFTITGGVEKYADRGIIPRTLSYLFQMYEKDKDLIYSTDVSYLEIYNECGYDLLDPRHEATKLEDLPKVSLMEDSDQNVHLRNMSVLPAQNEEEALNLLFLGDTNRMVAETPMNQASTRSHCIFTIHVTSREIGSATIKTSKLHLVDLAGSERVAKTKVGGQLLTEAKYINLSLHYLEQVIVALSEKRRQHIPYRNSMMTSVLRDSLGGNCMTTMIATVSVQRPHVFESISTCKFAQRVAMIKNEAILNEELDPKLMIARLKKEVQSLRAELALSTGEQRSDDLTEEEISHLNQQLNDYIATNDLESTLEVGGDMRKIQHCFRRFKQLVNEKATAHGNTSSTAHHHQHVNEVEKHINVTLDDKQIGRLREILEQRDSEISILVNMLKKERMKNSSQPNGSLPPTAHERRYERRDDRKDDIVDQHDIQKGDSASLAKKEAFETFKRSNENYARVEDQKQTLKVRYAEAKHLGQQVNEIRRKINDLKKMLEVSESQVDVRSAEELTEEKEVIRMQIDEWKNKYQRNFQRLKSMKTEIEHLHHILNKSRVQIQNNFEEWWQSQSSDHHHHNTNHYNATRTHQQHQHEREDTYNMATHQPHMREESPHHKQHMSREDSYSSRRSTSHRFYDSSRAPHGGSVSSNEEYYSASKPNISGSGRLNNIPLTGDSETDANILAFVKARQTFMEKSSDGS